MVSGSRHDHRLSSPSPFPFSLQAQESGMRNGWRVQGGEAGLRFLREHCWGEEEIILARKATLLCIGHGMKCFYLAVFSRSVMSDSLQLHGL